VIPVMSVAAKEATCSGPSGGPANHHMVKITVVIFEAAVVRITSTVVIVIALPVVVSDASVLATIVVLLIVSEADSKAD
jgi:hypothetical protein